MCCCINLLVILFVCIPLAYPAAVIVSLAEVPYWCQEYVTLKCNVSGSTSCCNTYTRTWSKNTVPNTILLSNGISTPAGKYSEELVDNALNYFTMKINNIDENDFGEEYICSYFSSLSEPFKLNKADLLCTPCWKCGGLCLLFASIGIVVVTGIVWLIYLFGFFCCKSCCYTKKYFCISSDESGGNKFIMFGQEYDNVKTKKTLIIAVAATIGILVVLAIIAFVVGLLCTICYYEKQIAFLSMGVGVILFVPIFNITLKCQNSQSVESGSSCWPICRVGQDPNTSSSDPEKVRRSSKKESADKKPTGFVRPQPSRAQHLGTDNTRRAEYSAEDEMYSEKILKSNKPRLLPSIGQQTDSPRPLPQMPASAQQGGNQLAPLEKKKKKRKKKREAKQSDEENSTEL